MSDKHKWLAGLALDPIHIGTGEFRLGRVDNTIVREPGSNLPKIPGSSIAGVARAYVAMNTPDSRSGLKAARKRAGLTQARMAARLGIPVHEAKWMS